MKTQTSSLTLRRLRVGLAVLIILMAGLITLGLFLLWQKPKEEVTQTPLPTVALSPEVTPQPLVIALEITATPSATVTPVYTPLPFQSSTFTPLPSATFTLTEAPTNTATSSPTTESSMTPTLTPTITLTVGCPPPEGWVQHTVQAGETLFAYQLGVNSAVTVDDIITANCKKDRWVYEGEVLWLPVGAAANAPLSETAPTPLPTDPNAPPPPAGLSRVPYCPCEVTVRQGLRLEQIAEVIDSQPVGFSGRDFLKVAGKGAVLPQRDFLRGAPAGASLEGYIFPATYTITNEMDAAAFVSLALDTFAANIPNEWWSVAAEQGFTPYEVITLASIINRESRSFNQQILISSVFHNRLQKNYGLAASVTTQYAVGRAGNWWGSVEGIVSTYDSPYNTNLYQGLPPSPIASPSLEAIQAAIYPTQTNYLYFTASCTGSGNAFAETYEQHLANVRCTQ